VERRGGAGGLYIPEGRTANKRPQVLVFLDTGGSRSAALIALFTPPQVAFPAPAQVLSSPTSSCCLFAAETAGLPRRRQKRRRAGIRCIFSVSGLFGLEMDCTVWSTNYSTKESSKVDNFFYVSLSYQVVAARALSANMKREAAARFRTHSRRPAVQESSRFFDNPFLRTESHGLAAVVLPRALGGWSSSEKSLRLRAT